MDKLIKKTNISFISYIFHGAPMLAFLKISDLIINDNPCHQEALEVAKKTGADFITATPCCYKLSLKFVKERWSLHNVYGVYLS